MHTSSVLVLAAVMLTAPPSVKEPKIPAFPLGHETTFVTGPLAPDGYVDYATVLNDRYQLGATPENNAEVLLRSIFRPKADDLSARYFMMLGMAPPTPEGDYFADSLHSLSPAELPTTEEAWDRHNSESAEAQARPWKADEFPLVARWLDTNRRHIDRMVEASRYSDYFRPILPRTGRDDVRLLNGLTDSSAALFRETSRTLICRAMRRLGEGAYVDAWSDILACRRLGRLVARGPSFVELMVGYTLEAMACRAACVYVERASGNHAAWERRLAEWCDIDPFPTWAEKVNYSERFIFLDLMREIHGGEQSILYNFVGDLEKEPRDASRDLRRIDFVPALRDGNRFFDAVSDALSLPDRTARWDAAKRFDKDIGALQTGASAQRVHDFLMEPTELAGGDLGLVCAAGLIPSLGYLCGNGFRLEQQHDNLRVALALAAYKAKNGRFPESLDVLKPRYLTEVPHDFFAGTPLDYQPERNGYLLYSVGIDGRDDGGRGYDDEPAGMHDDLSVRVTAARKPTLVQP